MEVNDMFETSVYVARRDELRQRMGSGQILLLGNGESAVNFADNWYPFRQDSTFLYYFGVSIAGLAAIMDCDDGTDYLLGDDLSIEDVVWTGPQPSVADWAQRCGAEKSRPLKKLKSILGPNVHYLPTYRGAQTLFLQDALDMDTQELKQRVSVKLIKSIVSQRNIKSTEEIGEIDTAASITSRMHLEVMKSTRPNMYEHELVGVASKVAHDHNVNFSFLPILTKNGQTLHNHFHGNKINSGDLILFDGGTESSKFYAADMTRTFPVAGMFSTRQKEIYNVVHAAHTKAVQALRSGIKFIDVHLLASRELVSGLSLIGLMKGDPAEAVAAGAHTLFFQCGLGHMMGLDVHDMENLGEVFVGYGDNMKKSKEFGLKSLRLGRELEVGNVLTVEPGIYFIPELIDLYKSSNKYVDYVNYEMLESYRNFGGIRIEDDYLITKEGSKLLGKPLPRSSDDIEEIRKQALS